jgi:hypothetical protein
VDDLLDMGKDRHTPALTFTVGEYEVSGLVEQAEEKAEKEGAPFDLAEARRQAADRLVCRKYPARSGSRDSVTMAVT